MSGGGGQWVERQKAKNVGAQQTLGLFFSVFNFDIVLANHRINSPQCE